MPNEEVFTYELSGRLMAVGAVESLGAEFEDVAEWLANALLHRTIPFVLEGPEDIPKEVAAGKDPHLYRDLEDVFDELQSRFGQHAYETAVRAWNLSQSPEHNDPDRREAYRSWTIAELEAEAEALRKAGWSDDDIRAIQKTRREYHVDA